MSATAGPALPTASALPERPGAALADDVVVLLLIDVDRGSLGWGWMRLVLGRWPLRRVPGLGFAKVLGSGHDGGFGLRPSISRQGLLAVFDGEAAADAFLQRSPLVAAYRRHAREFCVAKLRAFSSRGSWAGTALAVGAAEPAAGPVAALTRGSIRPSRAAAFWRHAAPAQAAVAGAQGCRLAVGLGEAPLLRQATFTVWDSATAMDRYARAGAHLEAARAAQREGYFAESLFVRFVPLLLQGQWNGRLHGLNAGQSTPRDV